MTTRSGGEPGALAGDACERRTRHVFAVRSRIRWQTVTVATENGQPEDDIIGQRLRWGYFPVGTP